MDPLEPLLLSALSRVANGSLGAAGAQLWAELRKLLSGRKDVNALVESIAGGSDVPSQTDLAERLVRVASSDDQLRSDLEDWQARVSLIQVRGTVSNTVSGDVAGKVVQVGAIGTLRIE